MTVNHHDDAEGPVALSRALEQNKGVKAKAEAVAEDLSTTNDLVKERIAGGSAMVAAQQALTAGRDAKGKVQEVADDLDEVNGSLATGIEDLKRVNVELARARGALARTHSALATAREGERGARLRALHDSTTGLPNRDLFDDRLEQAISLARRNDWTLAVMFLDLDGFKLVNDSHGHAAGDLVLIEVAKRLLAHCRHEDSICRNGGDEFLSLLVNPQGTRNITRIATQLARSLARPIDAGGISLVVTSSIGIAVFPDDGVDGSELVRNADAAMYRAKRSQTDGFAFFDNAATLTASLF